MSRSDSPRSALARVYTTTGAGATAAIAVSGAPPAWRSSLPFAALSAAALVLVGACSDAAAPAEPDPARPSASASTPRRTVARTTPSEFAVWRPSTGTWYAYPDGTGLRFGASGDIPVPGTYRVNGVSGGPHAFWKPSTGMWYIRRAETGPFGRELFASVQWGTSGDIPVPADYDGDGTTDIAVWRPGATPGTGTFYRYPDRVGVQWGTKGDVPAVADYDGDGRADLAVWRPGATPGVGRFFQYPNRTGIAWGTIGDVPVPADYNGDGRAEFTVWRPENGTWYRLGDSTGVKWGRRGDIPLPGAYVSYDRADFVVFRPGPLATWHARSVADPRWTREVQWGTTGDVPVRLPAYIPG